MILPGEDGVDHINIYSKGETEVGRALSNFSAYGFTIMLDDWKELKFDSLEAYWYYLLIDRNKATSDEVDELRSLCGYAAKKLGKELIDKYGQIDDPAFEFKIRLALIRKVDCNQHLKYMLVNSYLPFCHYCNYNGKVVNAGFDWLVEWWERARVYYREHK